MMRCKLIIDQTDVALLVDKSSSSTVVYDMAMGAIRKDEIAKATRWLGVLRGDYPNQYAEITCNTLGHVQRNTARKGKERSTG